MKILFWDKMKIQTLKQYINTKVYFVLVDIWSIPNNYLRHNALSKQLSNSTVKPLQIKKEKH